MHSKSYSVDMTLASHPIQLIVNGHLHALKVPPTLSLLDLLQLRLGLHGSKRGCDMGACGACTVLVNGRRINACLALAVMQDGREVQTIEGLAPPDGLHSLQQAFVDCDALQCGYCTPGQIMSAVALIAEGHAGSAAEVREFMSGNLCRCGAYPNIVQAIVAGAAA